MLDEPVFVPGILLQHGQLGLLKIHPLGEGKQSRAGADDLARAAEHSTAISRLLLAALGPCPSTSGLNQTAGQRFLSRE